MLDIHEATKVVKESAKLTFFSLITSGFHALRRYDELKSLGVTHIISVLRWPIEAELVKPYKHLQIEVDDDEDENLLESFAPCNRFIEDALSAGGGVFVHWYSNTPRLLPSNYPWSQGADLALLQCNGQVPLRNHRHRPHDVKIPHGPQNRTRATSRVPRRLRAQ